MLSIRPAAEGTGAVFSLRSDGNWTLPGSIRVFGAVTGFKCLHFAAEVVLR